MNVHFGAFQANGLAYLNDDQAEALANVEVQANDVLLNITGASIGRVCVTPAEMAGARVNQHVCIVRATEIVVPRFLEAFLAAPEMQRVIVAENYGLTRQALTKSVIEGFSVPLPPKAEQRRIVAKLDALTARLARARAELDRMPVLAAKLRASALSLAGSGLLSAGWRMRALETESTSNRLSSVRQARASTARPIRRIVATVADETLPLSWKLVSPDEIASDERYSIGIGPFGSNLVKSDYRTSGVRLVFVRDIRSEKYEAVGARYVSADKAAELAPHVVTRGDVLITKMGDPPGDSSLYPNNEDGIITADCIKLRPNTCLAESEYLRFCIRFPFVQSQIGSATKGVAQQKISLDVFRRMALPLPPVEEQREICQRLTTAFARADRLEAEAARGRALLDRLESEILAKAFRGELVPQDPNDEPAQVLLDRIRAERAAAPKARRGRTAKAGA
jgi:type I restriction enzyme S subunit